MSDEPELGEAAKADLRTGLEQIEALRRGEYPTSNMTKLMPFETLPPEEGAVAFRATPDERFLNGFHVVHGGWAMTMLDNAMGLAAHSTLPAGEISPSHATSVKFVRPIQPDVPLKISATVVNRGGMAITVEGRIEDDEGVLYAHGTSSCLILRS